MKALTDYAEFISVNIQKFYNLIRDYDDSNKEQMRKEAETFISELYNLAGESIGISFNNIDHSNTKPETIVAVIIQASELWRMFCNKYEETYPDDPPYFDETAILRGFESAYKKGLIKNETI